MEMNGIQGSRIPELPRAAESGRTPAVALPGTPPRPAQLKQDEISFSSTAREAANGDLTRKEMVERARQKLAAGDLSNPAVYEKTAEKLLRSGELEDAE